MIVVGGSGERRIVGAIWGRCRTALYRSKVPVLVVPTWRPNRPEADVAGSSKVPAVEHQQTLARGRRAATRAVAVRVRA